jgi:hypothetical protein
MFLMIILGATRSSAPLAGGVSAPIAIGLALTLIHLISIPVTNTSVNPARSTGPALFVGDWAIEQLWMFWLAPILGAVVGSLLWKFLLDDDAPNPVDPAARGAARLAPSAELHRPDEAPGAAAQHHAARPPRHHDTADGHDAHGAAARPCPLAGARASRRGRLLTDEQRRAGAPADLARLARAAPLIGHGRSRSRRRRSSSECR